jgi:hypothetical protein
MRSYITLVIFLLVINESAAQAITNIENLRREGEIGDFLSSSFSFSKTSGNEERENYSLQLDLNTNTIDREILLIVNQSKRMRGDELQDQMKFMQFRYMLPSERIFDVEFYAQGSENPFQLYKSRYLVGSGLRFSLGDHLKIGTSIFYEDETSLLSVNKKTNRVNLYLSSSRQLNEISSLNYSFFYQPSIEDPTLDRKSSLLLSLNFDLSTRLRLSMQYSHSYDSDPPDRAIKADKSFITLFQYDLINRR